MPTAKSWNWDISCDPKALSRFGTYDFLARICETLRNDPKTGQPLRNTYVVSPDIVVTRTSQFNNQTVPILHAIISCKWTTRNDWAQNTRTEVLNLIRNRKDNLPHVVAITAEPFPSRIAALALGTGDLDCVYHFALHELLESAKELNNEESIEILNMMVQGRRLRDISDLPFDLAI